MDQKPQHKTRYTEHNRRQRKQGIALNISHRRRFLNNTPIVQTLGLTINKWDLMKLRSSVRERTPFTTPTFWICVWAWGMKLGFSGFWVKPLLTELSLRLRKPWSRKEWPPCGLRRWSGQQTWNSAGFQAQKEAMGKDRDSLIQAKHVELHLIEMREDSWIQGSLQTKLRVCDWGGGGQKCPQMSGVRWAPQKGCVSGVSLIWTLVLMNSGAVYFLPALELVVGAAAPKMH